MSSSFESTNSDAKYWDERWYKNEITFHKKDLNPMLVKHIEKLTENRTQLRFFFPLCGKAVDMKWLANQGHFIVGVEFNKLAIEQFFIESDLKFNVKNLTDDLKLFYTDDEKIKLYNADFYQFNNTLEERFDCVWDRGSFVAIPVDTRQKYVDHIQTLLKPEFRYLLDIIEYDPKDYSGPPHNIYFKEIEKLFGTVFNVEKIDSGAYRKFNENQKEVTEVVYFLTPKLQ